MYSNPTLGSSQAILKSGRGICPATGKRGNWSYRVNEDPTNPFFVISYGSAEPLAGWKYVGDATSGGRILIRETPHLRAVESWQQSAPVTNNGEDQSLAPIERRDRIYRAFFDSLRLKEKHRKQLERRGLTKAQIREQSFVSMPASRGRARFVREMCEFYNIQGDELAGVPGFYINDYDAWTLAGAEGLLIPVRDGKGRIQSIQIRPDRPRGKNKYLALSSRGRKGGASAGAPAGVLLPPSWKEKLGSSDHIWITEGIFKALALGSCFQKAVLWLPGSGMVNSALEKIWLLKPKRVSIAYDCDWRTNHRVRESLVLLAQCLEELGIEVRIVGWSSEHGKGIDDALFTGEMAPEDMVEVDLERLKASVQNRRKGKRLVYDQKKAELSWEPSKQLSKEEVRARTQEEILKLLYATDPCFAPVMAGTDGGKTFITTRFAPKWTVYVHDNYKALDERLQELLHLGKNAAVLYGRQSQPNPLSPEADQEQRVEHQRRVKRFKEAGCPNHQQASKAGVAGHNPCEGCALFKYHETPLLNPEPKRKCEYWPMRESIEANPPEYLLMTMDTYLSHPGILERYGHIIFDDVQGLLFRLTGEIELTREQILSWYQHPNQETTPEELQDFFKKILDAFNHRDLRTKEHIFEQACLALPIARKTLKQLEVPLLPCEERFSKDGETLYPPRYVLQLLEHIAAGYELRFDNHRLLFAQPHKQLIEIMKEKIVLNLDATAPKELFPWFSQLGFNLQLPELPRRLPRIIQIFDLLWNRKQVKEYQPILKAIIEKMGLASTAVFSFKPPEGESCPFDSVGYFGRDERGLNEYKDKGFKRLVAIGHYQIPSTDAEKQAWSLRAFTKQMGIRPPDIFHRDEEKGKGEKVWRSFNDPLRPAKRASWRHEDPLVEYLRRHHYSAFIVQQSSRHRPEDGEPAFVLSGEPVDGLAYEVPVELVTLEELARQYGVELPGAHTVPEQFPRFNEFQQTRLQNRIEENISLIQKFIQEHKRMPGFNETRRLLASEGKKWASIPLTKAILERCENLATFTSPKEALCPKISSEILIEKQEDNGVGPPLECSVSPALVIEEKPCGWYTPILKHAEPSMNLRGQRLDGHQNLDNTAQKASEKSAERFLPEKSANVQDLGGALSPIREEEGGRRIRVIERGRVLVGGVGAALSWAWSQLQGQRVGRLDRLLHPSSFQGASCIRKERGIGRFRVLLGSSFQDE